MPQQNRLTSAEEFVAAFRESGRSTCPMCSPDRRKNREKTLSVTVHPHETLWMCHHCEWAGKLTAKNPLDLQIPAKPKKPNVTPIPTKLKKDENLIIDYFAKRGVTIDDLSKMPGLTSVADKYFHGLGEVPAIGFVYGPKEEPTAIKWRPADGTKSFIQDGSAEEFYGTENLPEVVKELVIVEGEADVIALAAVGIKAISVPNGAPIKVSKDFRIDPEEDGKFGYVWKANGLIENAEKIILATDQDGPGEALAEELSRRIGKGKCWRTEFPEGCKDPTDVLREHGADMLVTTIKDSPPVPLAGVYNASEYVSELNEIYLHGHGKGESTGYPSLDELFTIKEGMLSIVTGLPSSGKSELIDQFMINLAVKRGWRFAVASFENPPSIHLAKLAEKIVGKPFYDNGPTPRMTKMELNEAVEFINEHFVFLEQRDGNLATIDSIIRRTKEAVMRLGVRGLVIDPYNYINMQTDNEHQAITQMLSRVVSFCQSRGIHTWFVAHPAKMQQRDDGTYPVPKGMHISGSAAWFAKADLGITVHRGGEGVEVHCWKSRFKWIGQQGMALLDYDVPTGRYFEPKPEPVTQPGKKEDWWDF